MVLVMVRIFENIKLAFQGIFSHKMRSFLTMLGIIIGIASIIAIVSTIKGTNEQIKNNLIGSGTNTVTITPTKGDYEYSFDYNTIPDYMYPITADTVNSIKKINNVMNASLYVKREYSYDAYHNDKQVEGVNIYGVDENYFDTVGLVLTKGRLFNEKDKNDYLKTVVIDKTVEKTYFKNESPIGQIIDIKGEAFVIIGVVEKKSTYTPNITSLSDYYTYMDQSSGYIYMTTSAWPMVYRFDEPESVVIRCKNTDSMTSVGKAAEEILNEVLGIDTNDSTNVMYKANDLLEQAKQIQELSNSTNSMLILIAGISLLVGGIGVMNIMLVSVTERTREIGLKKALGAKKKRILAQFLTEAAVLTSIGGIIGVGVGIGLAYLIHYIADLPVAISGSAIIVAVVFSAVVGIVFGLLPSVKASKLDPIEALRYE